MPDFQSFQPSFSDTALQRAWDKSRIPSVESYPESKPPPRGVIVPVPNPVGGEPRPSENDAGIPVTLPGMLRSGNEENPRQDFPFVKPASPRKEARYELLQQWEGTVARICRDEFTAILRDLTNPLQPEEEATFSRDEVSEGDLSLIAPGAVFYWSIGYKISLSAQKERLSNIRFRRLPQWTRNEVRSVMAHAEELEKTFAQDSLSEKFSSKR